MKSWVPLSSALVSVLFLVCPIHSETDETKPQCGCEGCVTPNPNDCSGYYQCQSGVRDLLYCAPGLNFNPATKACDIPKNVRCWNYHCPALRGMFKNVYDCGSFWHCSNGIPYLKDCPANLHWSVERNRCEWPCFAKCDPSVPPCPTDPTIIHPTQEPCGCKGCLTPHPLICSAYYRCRDGHRELVFCPSGLYFNKDTKVCDHPENVPCWDFICPVKNGMFKNVFDCGSFWHCSNGIPYLKDCPANLHWSVERNRCEWPCAARCDPSVLPCPTDPTPGNCSCNGCFTPHPLICSAYYVCRDGRRELVFCPSGLYFNKDTKVCDYPENVRCWDFICPVKNGMFKNVFDCGSFWHCSNGIPYLKDCPANLHWSVERNRCEWPCVAKCDPSVSPCPTDPSTTNPDTCDCNGCLTPHPFNCSAYYICIHGHQKLLFCPSGLYFNKHTKVCDYPENVRCWHFICPAKNGMFKNVHDCGSFWHCSNGIPYLKDCPANLHWSVERYRCEWPCVARCDPSVPPCPTDPTIDNCSCNGCLTPHPFNCSAYYRCRDGRRELVFCPSGFYFNKDTKVCDYPENVRCWHFICPVKNGMLKNVFDCGSFWHCSNGIPYLKDCPANLHWSVERNRCEWPCVAKCDPSVPTCKPSTTQTPDPWCPCSKCISEDPFDCRAFFKCEDGSRVKMYCPNGLYFNRVTRVCDYPGNVQCREIGDPVLCKGPNGKFVFPGNCNKYIECIHGIAFITECPKGQTFHRLKLLCVPSDSGCGTWEKSPICTTLNGLFPKEDDCTKFYHCSSGIAYLKNCPAHLHFNPYLQVCDWPRNVRECGKVIDPTPPVCIANPNIKCPSCACRVADPYDCSSFYECNGEGIACKRTCPSGLVFNVIKMECDIHQNSDCSLAVSNEKQEDEENNQHVTNAPN
ncbi:uncharacterized protein LOC143243779 isoform X2 [Tachypleus tridentatus]|uniref:uncharacterized protein LOC143243779 isoform X2 n=1 Tax=Tachypleus tridentatus TaxID=6853 RepID=UPI003FD55BA9